LSLQQKRNYRVLVLELQGIQRILVQGEVVVVLDIELEVVVLGTEQVVGKFGKLFLVGIVFVVDSLGKVGELDMRLVVDI